MKGRGQHDFKIMTRSIMVVTYRGAGTCPQTPGEAGGFSFWRQFAYLLGKLSSRNLS